MSDLATTEFEQLFASPELYKYLDKLRLDIYNTPELVWRLTDEQIGKIVTGLQVQSRIEIVSTSTAKKKKSDIAGLAEALGLTGGIPGVAEKKASAAKVKSADLEAFMAMEKITGGTSPQNSNVADNPFANLTPSVNSKLSLAERMALRKSGQ